MAEGNEANHPLNNFILPCHPTALTQQLRSAGAEVRVEISLSHAVGLDIDVHISDTIRLIDLLKAAQEGSAVAEIRRSRWHRRRLKENQKTA